MTQQVTILAAKTDDPSLICGNHVTERGDSLKSSQSSSSLHLHAVAWSSKPSKENNVKYCLCLVDFVAMEVSDRDGQL